MTLIDTNLLVYATFEGTPEHGRARDWIEARFTEGEGTVALCWAVLYPFLRLITSARVFGKHAVTVREGWGVVAAYLEQAAVRFVVVGTRHPAIAAELATHPGCAATTSPTSRSRHSQSSMGSSSHRTTMASGAFPACASSTPSQVDAP